MSFFSERRWQLQWWQVKTATSSPENCPSLESSWYNFKNSCQIKSINHKLIILETDRFYVALQKVGTDFDVMEKMFENHEPSRDRKALKKKIQKGGEI